MIEAASIAKSARHAGVNALLTICVCVVIVAGAIAWDTKLGTKPLSWFNAKQQVSFDPKAY